MNRNEQIREALFDMQDLKYKDFHSKLIPNIDPGTIIGVRTPRLRDFSRKMKKDENIEDFLAVLPHQYYEENNLHAFLIEQIKDYDECVAALNQFLLYVDNWATCDMMRPKCFKKHKGQLLEQIQKWLADSHTYTVRFGIEMLMTFYLDEEFDIKFLDMVAAVKSDEYYINMMIAWYFATALAEQYESTIPYIEKKRLPVWVHNKTIQKAIESYRITDEQKVYLRGLKQKA
ncbi:MAG: DNA alkylation repair protein [Roseburia sp.]|nr:DNA alkylation repair protein [Roseburia sp.]